MKAIIQILCYAWLLGATIAFNLSNERIVPVREAISIAALMILIASFGITEINKNK